MMNVPAAFRTAPRIPPDRAAARACECGAALIHTCYMVGRKKGRRFTVATPVLWCVHCLAAAFARPVTGQTEVRCSTYMRKCEQCGAFMRRLHLANRAYAGQAIPLSYCAECGSVSFRPLVKRDESPKCHMCGADIPFAGRWCSSCAGPVKNWTKRRGAIPLPGEDGFEEAIQKVREYAANMGRGWKGGGSRVCTACQAEFAQDTPRQRRCSSCLAEQRRAKGRRKEQRRRERARERRAAGTEAKTA